jgi:hypothetical protein
VTKATSPTGGFPLGKKPVNPLAAWPGGAKPKTVEALQKNLKTANQRLEEAILRKSSAWARVMANSEEGFVQYLVQYREEAEKESKLAAKLEKLINAWQVLLDDLRTKPAPVAKSSSSIIYHNPSPWAADAEREHQQRISGG